jgi:hypothetical protein
MGAGHTRLKSTLVLILLLRYKEVKEAYPQHMIIATMEGKRGVSIEILESWSDLVKEDFIRRNATSLTMSDLNESTMIPLGDIQTHISQQANTLRILETNSMNDRIVLNQLCEKTNQLQRQVNDCLEFCRHNSEVLNDIKTFLFNQTPITSTPPSTARTPAIASIFTIPRREVAVETTTSSEINIMPSFHNGVRDTVIAADRSAIASHTCGQLFYSWYQDELYSREWGTDIDMRNRKPEMINMIAILKGFLPEDTIIHRRPSGVVEAAKWMKNLMTMRNSIDKSVSSIRPLIHPPPSGSQKRKRTLSTRWQACYADFFVEKF